jgi:Uma2 family endonuclease
VPLIDSGAVCAIPVWICYTGDVDVWQAQGDTRLSVSEVHVADPIATVRTIPFEEFERRYAGKRYEYVDGQAVPLGPEIVAENGEVTVSPPKPVHGLIAGEITRLVGNFVRENRLGLVFTEMGFLMQKEPEELRAPDVAFVRRERAGQLDLDNWLPFPPDLAVEVVSEYDRAADLHRKIQGYIAHGTRLLWVVYPDSRQIVVYRPSTSPVTLDAGDTLDGGEVLPGFAARVEEIFAVLGERGG